MNLGAILENVIASHLPAAAARGVTLEKSIGAGACTVRGDPSRLEQIASNLLSNAVKFTPSGGSVVVSCRDSGGGAMLTVRDTGKGIRAEFLPYVFDRFQQAEASLTRKHRGLGLGLALVKFLVELHGGSVRAESEGEGRGSTFTVTLPVTAVNEVAAQASPLDACASLSGIKALVVDDEEDARALVRRILLDCEVDVSIAGSGAEALEQLPASDPTCSSATSGCPSSTATT